LSSNGTDGDRNGHGSKGSSSSLRFSVDTGSNTIRNIDNSIGISGIAQNSGVNSQQMQQVNVNANVGNIR
ncbi:MAG: hypothetical protein ACXW4I_07750, partial [Candidatus Deferrimicrobiaceae bacterium]